MGKLLREVSPKTSGGFVVRMGGKPSSFFRLSRGNSGMIVQKGGCMGVTANLG